MGSTPTGPNGVNPLGATRQSGPPAPRAGGFDLPGKVNAAWDQANGQHLKLLDSAKHLDAIRRELDSLALLGDGVTPEDVIKGAGALVGAGFAPQVLAQLLASMPTTGGQALQGWVQQQDEQVKMLEQGMQKELQQSSISRGLAAMTKLHMDHVQQTHQKVKAQMQAPQMGPQMGPQMAAPAASNQMMEPSNG